jgi:exodeoxyribonuclease-1
MQFAGQRTDLEFNPIGEPVNELVRLSDDTLPSPEALLVTGITPQQTVADGYSEAEFAKFLHDEVFTPDTIAIGFNNIRFDDEFMRHLFWRNFYDPYEWSWKDGRSRWDILDVVRMTRALRPEGIEWPVDAEGRATNRLELLTKLNGVDHYKAHDALSDVIATIEVAKLIAIKQPQLFNYLLKLRSRREVMNLVNLDAKAPFVYTSGRYDAEFDKTTVAFPLTAGRNGNVIVYDLRYDPAPLIDLSQKELAAKLFASWEERKAEGFVKIPVKELQYNKAPAVAPLGVLEQEGGWEKIKLDLVTIEAHKKVLLSAPHFAENIRSLLEGRPEFKKSPDVEAQLYDGFIGDRDRIRVETVRNASERELADFHPTFDDERLPPLLLRYKARNYPSTLSEAETMTWEEWRAERIAAKLPGFMASLGKAAMKASDEQQFVLQELQLWAESIAPESDL